METTIVNFVFIGIVIFLLAYKLKKNTNTGWKEAFRMTAIPSCFLIVISGIVMLSNPGHFLYSLLH